MRYKISKGKTESQVLNWKLILLRVLCIETVDFRKAKNQSLNKMISIWKRNYHTCKMKEIPIQKCFTKNCWLITKTESLKLNSRKLNKKAGSTWLLKRNYILIT